MKGIKYVFPNLLTLLNLLSGCVAIIIVFRGENEFIAGWLIFVAAVFDFLDGMVARMLDAKSDFGMQLDSLADIVSFGVAPSLILFNWLTLILTDLSTYSTFEIISANFWQMLVLLSSLLFVAGGALRLARFNVTRHNGNFFLGLPIPAAALIVASLWLLLGSTVSNMVHAVLLNIYVVLGLILALVLLMVSKIEMLSFKFSGFSFSENFYQYLVILAAAALFIFLGVQGLFYTLVFYVIVSLVKNLVNISKR